MATNILKFIRLNAITRQKSFAKTSFARIDKKNKVGITNLILCTQSRDRTGTPCGIGV